MCAGKKIIGWVAVAAVTVPLFVFAYASPGAPRGAVNDFAGMLTPSEVEGLAAKLTVFQQNTGNALVIATVPTLDGDTVENFAEELFKEWGIGEKGKDNGVLILIAQDSRDIRIEVGYGLEGALTDAQSYWLIQNVMIPAFREGNFYKGLDGAADKIIAAVEGEVIPSDDAGNSGKEISLNLDWFFFILFIPLWFGSILARSKSWWAGGVVGGVAGIIIGFVKGFLYAGIISIVLLIPIGLLFDYVVSKKYRKCKMSGKMLPWWIGGGGLHGGGSGGKGGFGGFGGGFSGGGGASGRW